MKSAIFTFFVAFCIASVEDLKGKEAGSSIEISAESFPPAVENLVAPVERSPSPVPEIPAVLDEEKVVKKHAEPESKIVKPLLEVQDEFPITIVTSLSRSGSVLNVDSSFSDEEIVHKLMEIMGNIHEDFGSMWEKLKDAESWMKRLSTCVNQLSSLRLKETKAQKKDKKLKKEILKTESECYCMMRKSKDILNEIETKVRGLKEKVGVRSNRSQVSELIFRAEYLLLKRKLNAFNRDHDRSKAVLHEVFVDSKEVELQNSMKRNSQQPSN